MSLKKAFTMAQGSFGREDFKLNQKKMIERLKKLDNKGICQGICMSHAALAKAGEQTKDTDRRKNGYEELFAYSNKAQQHFESVTNPDSLEEVMRAYKHLGQHFNLKVKTIKEYSCSNADVTNMYQWANNRKPGYFQVLLPNHVVSFHITDTITYFDPNCGSTLFGSLNNLESFLNCYHTHPEFKKKYGLGEVLPSPRPVFLVGLE